MNLYSVKQQIGDAFDDSDERTPLLFLVSHSVDIQEVVQEFHTRDAAVSNSTKLQHFSMGKGLEEQMDEALTKAAQNGDWLILENLHLVSDWLPKFEEIIQKLKGHDLSNRFRIFATTVTSAPFPTSLTEGSIKIALQPPR